MSLGRRSFEMLNVVPFIMSISVREQRQQETFPPAPISFQYQLSWQTAAHFNVRLLNQG